MQYIPYTNLSLDLDNVKTLTKKINKDNQFIHVLNRDDHPVKQLEQVRLQLNALKNVGMYTAEIQNAVKATEEAMVYLDHYWLRRQKNGIYHEPVPEDVNAIMQRLNQINQPLNITIKFNKDTPTSSYTLHEETFENALVSQVIPVVYGLLSSQLNKVYYYILEDTPEQLTMCYVVPSTEDETFLDVDVKEIIDFIGENTPMINQITDIKEELHLFDLSKREETLTVKLPETLSWNNTLQSYNPKRVGMFFQELTHVLQEKHGLYLLGSHHPEYIYYFTNGDTSDNPDTVSHTINKLIEDYNTRHFA